MNDARELKVLALNSGSSSLKFGLYQVHSGQTERLISGEAESIGEAAALRSRNSYVTTRPPHAATLFELAVKLRVERGSFGGVPAMFRCRQLRNRQWRQSMPIAECFSSGTAARCVCWRTDARRASCTLAANDPNPSFICIKAMKAAGH